MRDDLDTYYLRDNSKINVPDKILLHLTAGQTTVKVRGMDEILAVRNQDGTFAGVISSRDISTRN